MPEEQKTLPPAKGTGVKIAYQNTESGAGEQLLPLDRRAKNHYGQVLLLRPMSYLRCSYLRFRSLDFEAKHLKIVLKTSRGHLLQDSS